MMWWLLLLLYKGRARHELRSNATLMFSCQILFFSVVELSSEITVDVMLFRNGSRAKCAEKLKVGLEDKSKLT